MLVLAALLALGVIGWGIYAGKPAPPRPISAPGAQETPPTLDALEAAARAQPDDPTGWSRLGLAYYDAERFADAASAYDRAAGLSPGDASLWSALGEARVMASKHDPMPAQAASAFEKAVSIDPRDPRARYFLAVKRDLSGDHKGALADWSALLEDTPADAPWHDDLVRTIEQVGKINRIDVSKQLAEAKALQAVASPPSTSLPLAAQGIPGPTQQDLAAASAMRPSDQRAMAEAMVERLDARLKADPSNVDGWVMLMRSRKTLGQPDKAANALSDAVAANPARADYLREQAHLLGVK